MTDIADLVFAPTNDDERAMLRENETFFQCWKQISSEDAHHILEELLALRQRRLRDENPPTDADIRALSLARSLIEGVVGWAAAERLHLSRLDLTSASLSDGQVARSIAMESLKLPLPLMPRKTQQELVQALDSLYDGVALPMVLPEKLFRKGIAPRRSAALQLEMLRWVEWKVHTTDKGREALLLEVAQACGIGSSQAVRKWHGVLDKHFSEGWAAEKISAAGRIGELMAENQCPTRGHPLWAEMRRLQAIDLDRLGREYRESAAKRKPPN